ncbi:hypothetical protein [Rahnella aceris]|uniref:hypothetical protein n=1 Tax=Rahnella sp. (strain Y9602) TaxID=2703885 RepID=UPI0036463D1B
MKNKEHYARYSIDLLECIYRAVKGDRLTAAALDGEGLDTAQIVDLLVKAEGSLIQVIECYTQATHHRERLFESLTDSDRVKTVKFLRDHADQVEKAGADPIDFKGIGGEWLDAQDSAIH